MEKDYKGIDYMIIAPNGEPATFANGDIVIYGDAEEACSDVLPYDRLSAILYTEKDGVSTAHVSKPASEEIVGSFTYIEDEDTTNFQTELKIFLQSHPFETNFPKQPNNQ